MEKAQFIQENEFQELLQDSLPIVIDYTAHWCGPCRLISPLIDQLASEYQNRAKVCKIDIDDNRDNAKKHGIKSIPAVLFFKNGEVVDTIVGKATYETFKNTLEKHL